MSKKRKRSANKHWNSCRMPTAKERKQLLDDLNRQFKALARQRRSA